MCDSNLLACWLIRLAWEYLPCHQKHNPFLPPQPQRTRPANNETIQWCCTMSEISEISSIESLHCEGGHEPSRNVPHASSHGCWSHKMRFSAVTKMLKKADSSLKIMALTLLCSELLSHRQILMLHNRVNFMCMLAILLCTAQGVVENAEQDDSHCILWFHAAKERPLWYVRSTIWQTAL